MIDVSERVIASRLVAKDSMLAHQDARASLHMTSACVPRFGFRWFQRDAGASDHSHSSSCFNCVLCKRAKAGDVLFRFSQHLRTRNDVPCKYTAFLFSIRHIPLKSVADALRAKETGGCITVSHIFSTSVVSKTFFDRFLKHVPAIHSFANGPFLTNKSTA